MVLESIYLGYFNADETDVNKQAELMARRSTGKKGTEAKDSSLEELKSSTDMRTGGLFRLKNDESMKFLDLKTPSNNFRTANEWVTKLVAMSSGYPPEFILSEYSTSYTAHKGALNDAWKKILTERATFAQIVDRVVNWQYLKYFIENDMLPYSDRFDLNNYRHKQQLLAGKWLGPVPGHINPLQEVNAHILQEQSGYVLKSDVASLYGTEDWWSLIEEWAKQQKQFSEASPGEKAETIIKEDKPEETIIEDRGYTRYRG